MEFGPIRNSPKPEDKPKQATPPAPQQAPAQSSRDRSFYGFDDIPVDDDVEDVRFVDILKAWAQRSIKHSPLENGAKKAAAQKSKLHGLKNDIKWAMQADLDEPVKPRPKSPAPTSQKSTDQTPPLATSRQAVQPTTPKDDPSKTIDININFNSLPKLPKLTNGKATFSRVFSRLRAFRPNKIAGISTGIVAIVLVGLSVWYFVPGFSQPHKSDIAAPASGNSPTPTYSTVLPDSKSIDSLGGWHRVSPEDRDPVYAYSDKINDVSVIISQQPLPESFKSDTSGKVAELAKSYGATNKVSAGDQTVYIGNSENGPQSAIVVKNNTLILMKSTKKIPDASWSTYVESLK